MKAKTTRRALFMSVLSLLLCVSMLVGTTFAWFTDSVTSANNIIKSGNLDVEMYWADGTQAVPTDKTGWTDASQGAIFNYDLWEPGFTQVRHIKIANAGTLALKYKVNIIPNGEVSDLADVIDVYYVDPAVQVANRTDLTDANKLGTLTEVLAKLGETGNGELIAGASDTITIAFKMQETAGNEYMNMAIGTDFSVQLLATQLTSEDDSFDNQYDAFAEYDGEISTAEALVAAFEKGGTYKVVSDISLDAAVEIPVGKTVALDLNGQTITGTKGRDADNNRIHVIVNNGILTIKDGTVKSAGNDGGSAIYNNAGATLTIEDVTLYGAPQSDPVYEAGVTKPFPSYAVNNYGNAVVNGATVKSYHGAIATGGDGVTVINDADIDVGLGQSTGITSYAIYSYENAQVTVNGGKFAFTKQEVYVNGGNTFCELGTNPIIVNGGNYIGTSFSTGAGREYVIKGGTFDKDPTAYVANGCNVLNNGDGTYTVINVKAAEVNVYGLTLIPNGENSKIVVDDKEGFLNLTKLFNDWTVLFTDGNGNEFNNYANGAGADYYYGGRWTISLEADIDLNNVTIAPVTIEHPVSAGDPTFDGNNHTIKNAKIVADAAAENMTGLFNVSHEAFKNLKLDNIHVTGSNVGNSSAGILAGSCHGRIDNITITNSSVTGGKYTGGVVGYGYTDVLNCTLTNVTVKGGYKLGGIIGYICASNGTGDVTGNTLDKCTVDGIGNGIFAGGKTEYVIGQVVGNYDCNGTCNNNTVTNMTSSVSDAIGKIEAGKTVTQ